MICEVPGCERHYGPSYAEGKRVCRGHESRYLRYGDFHAHVPIGKGGRKVGLRYLSSGPLAAFIKRYRENHTPNTYALDAPDWLHTLDTMTYDEMAERCGVKAATLRHIVSGRLAQVEESVADRICIKLDGHLCDLYGDEWFGEAS